MSTPNASPELQGGRGPLLGLREVAPAERPPLGEAAGEVGVPAAARGARPPGAGRSSPRPGRPVARRGSSTIARWNDATLKISRSPGSVHRRASSVERASCTVARSGREPVPQAGLQGVDAGWAGRRCAGRRRRRGCPPSGPRPVGRRTPAPGPGCPAPRTYRGSSGSSPQSASALGEQVGGAAVGEPGPGDGLLQAHRRLEAHQRVCHRGQPLVDLPGPGEVAGPHVVRRRPRTTAAARTSSGVSGSVAARSNHSAASSKARLCAACRAAATAWCRARSW